MGLSGKGLSGNNHLTNVKLTDVSLGHQIKKFSRLPNDLILLDTTLALNWICAHPNGFPYAYGFRYKVDGYVLDVTVVGCIIGGFISSSRIYPKHFGRAKYQPRPFLTLTLRF